MVHRRNCFDLLEFSEIIINILPAESPLPSPVIFMRFVSVGAFFSGLLMLAAFGCGPGEPTPVPVHGTVSLDGTPLADGQISFITPGQVPEVIEIKNGVYNGKAKWGKRRIEIGAYRALQIPPEVPKSMYPLMEGGKENYVPEKYNVQSDLSAEVKAKGSNEFNFELYSK